MGLLREGEDSCDAVKGFLDLEPLHQIVPLALWGQVTSFPFYRKESGGSEKRYDCPGSHS